MSQIAPYAIVDPITGPPALGGLLRTVEVDEPVKAVKKLPAYGQLDFSEKAHAEAEARRWEAGLTYRPLGGCAPADVWVPCVGATKVVDPTAPIVKAIPFTVYAGFTCSTWALAEDERIMHAEIRLNARAGQAIESELWKGTSPTAEGWPSPFLASPAATLITTGIQTSPFVYALGNLQDAIRSCYGSDFAGVIHCTPMTATVWAGEHLVKADKRIIAGEEKEVLVDLFGNLVVAGGGYDGSSPAGTIDPTGKTAWAYATGPVKVMIGPTYITPDETVQALDRTTNDITWRAERSAIPLFDPCCLYGINVDLCTRYCS